MDTAAIYNHFTEIIDKLWDNEEYREYLEYPDYDETHYCDNITLASGVTRLAIIDDNYDWIVKIDIEDNYCDWEEELYNRARYKGIEDMFAACFFIGRYMDWNLYAYEKADCSYHAYDIADEDRYSGSPLSARNPSIAADMLKMWGQEKFDLLTNFCIDNRISDLHCGNVGYICGKLVLTDYAGYGSCSSR